MPAAAKQAFRPRLVSCLQSGYHRVDFFADLGAGVTVGVVALPLAMAFAIASGVPPQAGIYTAIIAGFLRVPDMIVGVLSLAVLLLWPKAVRSTGEVLDAEAHGSPSPLPLARDRALGHSMRRGAGLLVRMPSPIVVLVVASIACGLLAVPLATIGTRFGGIPTGLPEFALPVLSLSSMRDLIAPTITIALLGAIESLLSARVADTMIGDRHDPNQELIAQGVANLVAPLFGGISATGAIARTATNVRTGAARRSPASSTR